MLVDEGVTLAILEVDAERQRDVAAHGAVALAAAVLLGVDLERLLPLVHAPHLLGAKADEGQRAGVAGIHGLVEEDEEMAAATALQQGRRDTLLCEAGAA